MLDIDTLRQVPIFSKLPNERLQWLLQEGKEVWLKPGEIHRHEGDRADHVFVLLEGSVRITQKVANQDILLANYEAKTLYGELPVLMGKEYFWASGRAVTRCQILELPNAVFWDMLSSCNCVMTTILRTMAQRVRALESMSQHREKLVALGTLAAGLAHELNNPASASRRAAGQLRETVQVLQPLTIKLNQQQMTCAQKAFLAQLQKDVVASAKNAPKLDPLEESDRSDELTAWLDAQDIIDGWKLAPVLVTAGLDLTWLENVKENVGDSLLNNVLSWIGVTLQEMGLLDEIEHCTDRISTLVEAVKDYSYMDQAPLQEIDVHDGIESTLTILSNKIKHSNVVINREYGCDIPQLYAYGRELNQVWTNLIDNAIDALNEMGTDVDLPIQNPQIWIRTSCDLDELIVEIADNGPGIPPEIQSHIFEPFFTTKGVGAGTGLGLHIAYRIIVGQHQGDIRLFSQPGDTRFQVRLPCKLG
ncbi:ATP-binding protein [Iningainema tapete]|uniref:histidine kinase n=1 Tax=Iningainema tapete BLCC-T55 TaxID=2748662 RepID=A0A8J7BZN2_9CYAN|nr:ATP-binding protein [Iningainema tapete]MBD2776268.1 cyclic nucleotide-binding domain-containing protein [Iningainema tapete BLCC-T55]